MLLTLVLALATNPTALVADPTPLESRIADVTVYPSSALVHRTARVSGPGKYRLAGLPAALDPGSVRVRCDQGTVLGVEVRQRMQAAAPSERIESLRTRLAAARDDVRLSKDRQETLDALEKHLMSLLRVDEEQARRDVREGRASTESWDASWGFAVKKLGDLKRERRETDKEAAARAQVVADLEAELGRIQGQQSVPVHDVLVEIETSGAGTAVDIEYIVSGTGWKPVYDLRAAADVSSVALTYRARVWQRTGEDWDAVQLALSTAQPQRGAQGPEPQPVWVSIWQQDRGFSSGRVNAPASAAPMEMEERAKSLGDDLQDSRLNFEATVESQGVSVRFVLPRPESVQSRDEPSTVLVGQANLEVVPERWCVPAIDTSVWLRGRAKNTTAWTLLPGEAAVFIGRDFLGAAEIGLVQTGQELTLHLGADPAISVERIKTDDLSEGPGFLSSRATKTTGWRIHVENHGALSARADGGVELIVREVLPRSNDERVEVELTDTKPAPSKDERWKKEREEKGFVTWVVPLAREAKLDITWKSVVSYPKDAELVFR